MKKTKNKIGQAGFTLFELLITVAIVAMISGIVIVRMSDLFDTNIKKTVGRLGSTVRYLYNKAATENIYIRLVIDIDENKYSVEATSDAVLLINPEDVETIAKLEEQKKEEEKTAKTGETSETEVEAESDTETTEVDRTELKPKQPSFTAVESNLLKPQTLDGGVFFKDVQTIHQIEPVNAGKAYIYFFPNGYVENSVINFRNEDDDVNYGLEIKGLTGAVAIHPEYVQLKTPEEEAK